MNIAIANLKDCNWDTSERVVRLLRLKLPIYKASCERPGHFAN
jgi:hypothetical protein